ncbi:MAG TPA: DUF3078 domain-containing protein [Bacteroidales bacterium]|nr:DUF3078 domain-containing protein [Bacteroidales bacterium]
MRKELLQVYSIFLFLLLCKTGLSQENVISYIKDNQDPLQSTEITNIDEPLKPEVNLNHNQSLDFLRKKIDGNYWMDQDDPFLLALKRLVQEASNEKFDSVKEFLRNYQYNPFIDQIPETIVIEDSSVASIITTNDSLNALIIQSDTIQINNNEIAPASVDLTKELFQNDSLRLAIQSLIDYCEERDSSIIGFTGIGNPVIPFWINSKNESSMKRYWLKNEFGDDSVTVWIGNAGKNTLGLYLEHGIEFRKPVKSQKYSDAKNYIQKDERSQLRENSIILKKRDWNMKTESSAIFSQSSLSNWVKGGENSISSALDITGYADYNKPELKLSSSNFARLKLGFMASGGEAIRKNLDLLETNSKLNHKAFGKFDFSAFMLIKTQIAPGKQYSEVTDPVTSESREVATTVSKFLNPATITLGLGLDYKPDKETSISFSPLSYKGTFVTDAGKITADSLVSGKIDQTRYGIEPGKKSKNEPGASLMVSKISHPFENLTLTNRLQLFTNYLNNPQNIDVDWEMIAVYNLNWFTDLRFNTHLIFDDDTRTVVMDGKKPVLLEDGITQKKTARIQFKEMFGVSLVFRF